MRCNSNITDLWGFTCIPVLDISIFSLISPLLDTQWHFAKVCWYYNISHRVYSLYLYIAQENSTLWPTSPSHIQLKFKALQFSFSLQLGNPVEQSTYRCNPVQDLVKEASLRQWGELQLEFGYNYLFEIIKNKIYVACLACNLLYSRVFTYWAIEWLVACAF